MASFGAPHAAAQSVPPPRPSRNIQRPRDARWFLSRSGGPTDALARIVAQKLGERLGKPFVVVNKPGAGGNTGSAGVAIAPPDGYTLLLGTVAGYGINPSL